MSVWMPKASSGSAVLAFKQEGMWHTIKSHLGRKNGNSWTPVEAYVGRGKPKHFVYFGSLLTCNDSAWEVLKEDIREEAEDLPVIVGNETYHVFNVFNCIDCLDEEQSKFLRSPIDGSVMEVIQPVFRVDLLQEVKMFTVPQQPRIIYATDALKAIVESHNLKDIKFYKPVSPLEGIASLLQQGFVPPSV